VSKEKAIKELCSLSNIGEKIAEKLFNIGCKSVEDFKKSKPEDLYEKIRKKSGGELDKCVLYTFYGAQLGKPWWECKDESVRGKKS
jgi:hypothetical protein